MRLVETLPALAATIGAMRIGWKGSRRLLLSLMTLASASLYGQSATQLDQVLRAKMDEVVRRCIREDGTPSASVTVVQGGRLVYSAAFGDAAMHPKTAATSATRYQLASISKTFVAQSILLLEAEGKLSLDNKVSDWYPGLTGAAGITLRELLNHTSGYPDHYPQGYPAGPKGSAAQPEKIVQEWGHHSLLFPPGTQFHYSNLEYEMAGRIVEKVSGKPLFDFMQERIFKPLHMDATIDLETIPDGSSALATGYTQTALASLEPAPYEGPGWSFGSGQVVTTAQDVALWDAAFLNRQLLPAKQAAEEVTPANLANGSTYPSALGLFISDEQGVIRYYHSGEGLGFEAVNMIYPELSLALVVLTNTNVTPTYLKIADELGYLLLPATANDTRARTLFTQLQSGSLDRSSLSDDLSKYLSPGKLREYSSSLGPLGAVEAFSLVSTQTTDGMTAREYAVIVGGKRVHMHLLLLPTDKLEDVSVSNGQ
jgi:D-alanyl-D-alanine carboxypeptidase